MRGREGEEEGSREGQGRASTLKSNQPGDTGIITCCGMESLLEVVTGTTPEKRTIED